MSAMRMAEASASYGSSPIGRWLADIIEQVGAPEGYSAAASAISDTGTALELRLSQYADRFDLYVVAEKPPDLLNDSTKYMSHAEDLEGFEFFTATPDRWVSYLVRSPEWQLALLAFSDSDGRPAFNPRSAPQDWLAVVIRKAKSEPPP